MKGLVKYATGKGNMELRDVPEPSPGPGQVKIEVKAAGICGSDIHIYDYDIQIPMNPPVVTGHEFSGIIVEVGPGVEGFAPGDRVSSETALYTCGKCRYCKTGDNNLCKGRQGIGFWHNGAFAKYTVVPAEKVHYLPDNVSFNAGALMEPLASALNGSKLVIDIKAGNRVLLTGPGTIGLLAMQIAKAEGGIVTVVGTAQDDFRLQKALELGADQVVNVEAEGAGDKLAELGGTEGFDIALECSGSQAAAQMAFKYLRKKGKYSQIGLFGHPIQIDFEQISYKELTVSGSFSQKWEAWDEALNLLAAGMVKLEPLATHTFTLEQWEEAFKSFREKKGLKMIINP